jgi:hypothetical protein
MKDDLKAALLRHTKRVYDKGIHNHTMNDQDYGWDEAKERQSLDSLVLAYEGSFPDWVVLALSKIEALIVAHTAEKDEAMKYGLWCAVAAIMSILPDEFVPSDWQEFLL